jgi:YggT family protein
MSNIILIPLLDLTIQLLGLYKFLVIVSVIINLLSTLNIINTYNRGVFILTTALYRITEPALNLIRKIVPTVSGIDFSPVILIFVIQALQQSLYAMQKALM